MPRVPNTRATSIYWLLDVRPETLKAWPRGFPFYCGKTVAHTTVRLFHHRSSARLYPHRPVAAWFHACGEHVRIHVVEIVPVGGNWSERERAWIRVLRSSFLGTANVTEGGQGAPGNVHSSEARAKIRAAKLGVKRSADTVAKVSAARKGKKLSRARSAEYCAKISERRTGQRHSAEARAKMSAAKQGRPGTNKGRTFSAAARANMSAAAIRRCRNKSEELPNAPPR